MKLHSHQQDIVRWVLEHPRCAVWAPMGSGKTLATLTALAALRDIQGQLCALVLAPKRVAEHTWPDEARKWSQLELTVVPVSGSVTKRVAALEQPADVYTCSYDNLPWLVNRYGEHWPFSIIVADEATRLKSFRTRQGGKRASALGKVAHTKVERFVELTGTPAPNGLVDLWGQAWFLDKGERLGRTFSAFSTRWFQTGFNGWGLTPMPHSQGEIHGAVADLCTTVELPFEVDKPIVTDVRVTLPTPAMVRYRALERDMFVALESEKEITAVNAAVLTGKCQQFANGAAYVEEGKWEAVHDEKLDALESIIEEAAGAPVMVAYQFRSDAARIARRFPHARWMDARSGDARLIEDWNAGKVQLLLMHPMSAGHGLNLQYGGNIIVWYGLPWSLELYEQAIERIGPLRQMQAGLNRPCYVYRIVASGTVDELIVERLEGKRSVQEILLDAMKSRC